MKKLIILLTTLAFSASLIAAPVSAAELEPIPGPDQIKYFRVVKQEGGTLYGIRIAQAVKEDVVEKIASPDQIKYYRVVRQEGGTLYGVRIASAPVVKAPAAAVEPKKDSLSGAVIERILSPDDLKYFRVVKREGGTLFGVRIFSKENSIEIDGKLRMTHGAASWYRFRNGLFAASPDYPRGSVLRVTNVNNGKTVDVTINDFGPDRNLHPDRVIDLDYVAFSEIASPGAGIIQVSVEPLSIPGSDFGILEITSIPDLNVEALSAIVMKESNGEIVYGKNVDMVLPIASLTKLVFAKVFLDLNPDFDRVVSYKQEDSEKNHLYVTAGLEARLRNIEDGDTITVGDLFYSAIVGSANNVVETLVRTSGISRDQFILRMNEYARSLGAVNTTFVEPTGLSSDNVSSAREYAILARDIFADKRLKEISALPRYTAKTINSEKTFNIVNTNQLLQTSTYSVTGSKTGYLHKSGFCLVTQVKNGSDSYIILNLNSETREKRDQVNSELIKYSLSR